MMLGTTLSIQRYADAAPVTCLVMAKNAILPKIIEGESFGSLYQIIWQPTKLHALDGSFRTDFDP
jgi:hypothetical protein